MERRLGALRAHLSLDGTAAEQAKIPTVHCQRLGYDFPVVGLGGFGFTKYVGGESASPEERATLCSAAVVKAIEMGCTYIDVAPGYGGGEAERLLGPALAPHREKVFLSCKTGEFRKSTAAAVAQMENSLAVLQTSYFDLFQFHAVTTDADVDKILGDSGALEAVKLARSQGKVRAIGFSAHDEAAALRLIRSDEFDTVMFPLNYFSHSVGGVGHAVLQEATARGMGIFALKSMARCRLEPHGSGSELAAATANERGFEHPDFHVWYQPETDPVYVQKLLRYTLSLGAHSCLSPGHLDLFDTMAAIAKGKTMEELGPLTEGEQLELAERYDGLVPVFHVGNHGGANMQSNWPNDLPKPSVQPSRAD